MALSSTVNVASYCFLKFSFFVNMLVFVWQADILKHHVLDRFIALDYENKPKIKRKAVSNIDISCQLNEHNSCVLFEKNDVFLVIQIHTSLLVSNSP